MLVAPAGKHMTFDEAGRTAFNLDPPLWGVRPAADITFRSAALRFGSRTVAVVLTGMGKDGALGTKSVRLAGGPCFAQDEFTSVIYGMPRAAVELGGVEKVLPLGSIASAVADAVATESRSGTCTYD